ncbi:dephospho-CoA kinase [Vibrio sp. S9_S30]|uniref:dephospho-CoA kinase n=1 Tax=Vibrio sp. S9_S30 TaxID=2720226 RepID=UPI00167FF8A2|nr:dephospho-CoA kinase [Vibrio sp. S9_S30]MBD1555392.1 dephospho-CoA kinase [Vibrio sp. S9_S30]
MAFVVGLTGGIASGKTTVANLFQKHFNIDIVDADVIARQVVAPHSEGLKQIAAYFGTDILNSDGSLNRIKLRARVFENEKEKLWLNNLLHPMIRQKMKQSLKQVQSPYALLVVPLLVENQLQSMADTILVVDVTRDTQIQRTMNRDDVPLAQIESILNSQATREERLSYANNVIDNDSPECDLLAQVTALHHKYMAMSH